MGKSAKFHKRLKNDVKQIISTTTIISAPQDRKDSKDSISKITTSKITKKKSNKKKVQDSMKKSSDGEITRDYVDLFSGKKLYRPIKTRKNS
ncbi:hypothetical protein Glove_508g86 [Diversispora epigaea]|uniref:Uncharacterized protein n=1 Tax=Diversispora epigaea TaxID=1348612 RepID=A0A397GG99_9GLOM|nr:hypothetical protein Glove_508g86 [Diversispora epigaea]